MHVCKDRCRDFEIAHRSCAAGKELISLGHEVTLFASGDSATSATLVPVWRRTLRLDRPKCDPAVVETALRVTIQAWDSYNALKAWFNGADYQAALKIGEKYATFRRFAVEGQ
jgi:hypothetical protein